MNTWARVTRVTVRPRAIAGKCQYCGERHMPPYSYWFQLYAYLAGWLKW